MKFKVIRQVSLQLDESTRDTGKTVGQGGAVKNFRAIETYKKTNSSRKPFSIFLLLEYLQ